MEIKSFLSAIESELQRQVARIDSPSTKTFHEMLTYHMGWSGEGAGPEATGKRVRPLLVLLSVAGCGADWQNALPAAAAVELIHNFSLVHDDIQDNSEKRRGRPTAWIKWGAPQAINAGDALFVLASLALTDLSKTFSPEIVLKVSKLLHQTCLDLTLGQFMDMSYEDRGDVKVEDYWPMINGKTAALLSACCRIGSILGGADEATEEAYRSFGHYLGLAFQIQDDIIGIWGDENVTGKSAASDLVEGKKSLPVLVGLNKQSQFAVRWAQGPINQDEVEYIATLLANEGAYTYAYDIAQQMTDMALNSLREADPQGEAGVALMELTEKLLSRSA